MGSRGGTLGAMAGLLVEHSEWLPCFSVIAGKPNYFSPSDWELLAKRRAEGTNTDPNTKGEINLYITLGRAYVRKEGLAESIFRDMRARFGKREFDPMEIDNPFPNNEGSLHLWHGEEDGLVPVLLQRYA
nr:alpha/beta hydrolases superfamily protein [Tanacetum cinerariifolium]